MSLEFDDALNESSDELNEREWLDSTDSDAVSLVFSAFALKAVTAVTLVEPIPTSFPPTSSFSLPSGFSVPSVSIPIPTSTPSVTAIASISIGGVASDAAATTYFLEDIIGIDGSTSTFTQTIVQGDSVWLNDELHESCSLDGKGVAVCVIGAEGFQTTFTGSAVPITTLGAGAAPGGGAGGGGAGAGAGAGNGGAGSGGSGSAANPTKTGAAKATGASVAMLVMAVAVAGGMRIVL